LSFEVRFGHEDRFLGVDIMTRPKLCLINPPHPYLNNPTAQAPLGMLYVAASARDAGFDVSFVDLSADRIDSDFDLPSAEVYGLTSTILDAKFAAAVARHIRKRFPKSKTIVGGPISISPEQIDSSLFDSIVRGEGERVILDVLFDYPNLKGEYVGERLIDLDALPFPARDMISGSLGGNVFAQRGGYFGEESTVIATSRGCPFGCVYCASPGIWNRRIVYRSAENVFAEIDEVEGRFGVRQFRFSDDNVTTSRRRIDDLCGMLRRKGSSIAWRASIRTVPNDLELFETLKSAGCVEASFGVESGDQDVLDALQKQTTVEDNRTAILNAKKAEMDVRILFMIGTPGETLKTVDRNIEFLESVKGKYDAIALTNFVPLPGSKVAMDPASCSCDLLEDAEDVDNFNLCMYGPSGRNRWMNLVRPHALSLDELSSSKRRMADYIISTGRSNHG